MFEQQTIIMDIEKIKPLEESNDDQEFVKTNFDQRIEDFLDMLKENGFAPYQSTYLLSQEKMIYVCVYFHVSNVSRITPPSGGDVLQSIK